MVPYATAGTKRSITVETWSTAIIFLDYCSQQRVDFSRMQESGDNAAMGPLEAANGFVEPSLNTSHQGLYLARTLVQTQLKVSVMNVSDKDQVLTGCTTLGCCEPDSVGT